MVRVLLHVLGLLPALAAPPPPAPPPPAPPPLSPPPARSRPAASPWPDGLADFDAWWDYDDAKASERRFRAHLPAAFASGNLDYLLQVLTQLARAEGLLGRYDAAHSTLDQVLADLRPELPVARVRYLLERGRVYNSSGQPGRALPLFHDAWEAARAAAVDHLAIDAAHMIALCESGAEVGRWNREALDLASRSAEVRARRWRGSILNNMGWSAFQAEDFGLALDLFRQALRAREEDGKPKEIRVARWCVGRALRALHRTSEALQMQQSLAKDLVAAGERDGYVSEEIGECLLALGRGAEAAPHFAAAWRELRRDGWLVDHEGARLDRLRTLGGVPPAP